MLTNTFIHIPGIGLRTEQSLWNAGITTWESFDTDPQVRLSLKRRENLMAGIDESHQHLQNQNPWYFSERMPGNQIWRLFPEFRDSIAYVDIETTGLDKFFHNITTITLYDGQSIKTYVQGQNLNHFPEEISKYRVVVTYNGKCFDVPFIESQFKIRINQVHIDLRWVMQSLGFKGGLKGCEKQLGIERGNLEGVDGYMAVQLWENYRQSGDEKVLDTLLSYNVQDTVVLERLMDTAYNLKLRDTPFLKTRQMPDPVLPENPFRVDVETIERLKRESGYGFGYWR